jgi:hypothetical protein
MVDMGDDGDIPDAVIPDVLAHMLVLLLILVRSVPSR